MVKHISITLILGILCELNVNAQLGQTLSVFTDKPQYVQTKQILDANTTNLIELGYYLTNHTYSFTYENDLYMLSYSNDQNRELNYKYLIKGDGIYRELYVYKLNKCHQYWEKVSESIKTDYRKCDSLGRISYSYYYPRRLDIQELVGKNTISKGSININENIVIITLLYFEKSYNSDSDTLKHKIIKLKYNNKFFNIL